MIKKFRFFQQGIFVLEDLYILWGICLFFYHSLKYVAFSWIKSFRDVLLLDNQ